MKSLKGLVVVVLLMLLVGQAVAQGDCPSIVQAALAATDGACGATGRNQACYGNINLQAVMRDSAGGVTFAEPGDLINIADVQSLTLSPLNTQENVWGVALLSVQANLPETLPGQNVTFLLFGDVQIENAVQTAAGVVEPAGATLTVTVNGLAPLMESLTSTNPPEMLNNGTQATADGRDPTGQMLHIQLADGKTGWTIVQMVTVQGDVNTLPLFDMLTGAPAAPATNSSAAPQQNPMQAFYFKTGAGDAPCDQAPDSGILIQTPEGAGKISLTMNGVDVSLGSTAYVQSGQELTVNVVEGQGLVSAEGVTRVVPAGSRVRVPQQETDGDLTPSGPPSEVEPYDASALAALPVGHLPRVVSVAPALTADQLLALSSNVEPIPGPWRYISSPPVATGDCPAPMVSALSQAGPVNSETVILPEGPFNLEAALLANGGVGVPGAVFSNPEPGLHIMESSGDGTIIRWEFRVISSTLIEYQTTISFEGCTLTTDAVMQPA